MKKCLFACLFLHLQHAMAAPIPPSPLAAYLSLPFRVDSNVTFKMPDQTTIALMGQITPASADAVTNIPPGAAAPKTLYIDSGGGDVPSALRLANFVREHDVRLIVVGRCFSACAHYVFSGARRKEALPGSLIGIHSKRLYYKDGDKLLALNTSLARDKEKIMATPATRREYGDMLRLERDFYAKAGISTRYHDIYTAFDAARGTRKPASCRNVDLWILDRPQLEAMGVKGIGAFWAPASAKEARAAAVKLGLQESQVFFGSPAELGALCKPTLLERVRALF
jgi:hypothetical protein